MPKNISKKLTIERLKKEASVFIEQESHHYEPSIYRATDGKVIGTYLEHKFQETLSKKYNYRRGRSAKGIDFPGLGVDMKVTKLTQPQSSCPYQSARQKIFGLGYSLLLFVYDKIDDKHRESSNLKIVHSLFIDKDRSADWQTTQGIHDILKRDGNDEDLFAFFKDRNLPVDEITAKEIIDDIIQRPPKIGYLTISNALQWRLQYKRAIDSADKVDGIYRLK
ncbi:MAG: hypothetical protein OXE77_04710 [Flavobacteriaceae bacterium]|nr:hypothetical protein [Flavobacteriaceae bacterium]MCY4267292.1 hypothetical protein [Flavobacteriaceae bacterium]MCY4298258.1 hypothetical protein [Flavobacteriaceae bacterium]